MAFYTSPEVPGATFSEEQVAVIRARRPETVFISNDGTEKKDTTARDKALQDVIDKVNAISQTVTGIKGLNEALGQEIGKAKESNKQAQDLAERAGQSVEAIKEEVNKNASEIDRMLQDLREKLVRSTGLSILDSDIIFAVLLGFAGLLALSLITRR